MHHVRTDVLSDKEIQNRNCSRFSTIILYNFSQTFAIYRPNNNVFVLQNSLNNLCVNSSSTNLKNNCKKSDGKIAIKYASAMDWLMQIVILAKIIDSHCLIY